MIDRDFGGGAAWSFGHEATGSPITPSGGFTQFASGVTPFAIDPLTPIDFLYTDVDLSGELDVGDTITFGGVTVDIFDYSGSVTTGTLTTLLGTIMIDGMLTVAGAGTGSPSFDYGVSGDLDFVVTFTAAASRGGYAAGDVIDGTATFQVGDFVGPFNGVEANPTTNTIISLAIWGDNRDGTGAINGTYTPFGGSPIGDYSFGLDVVLSGSIIDTQENFVVPEPASLALISIGALGLIGFGYKRGRYAA